MIEVIATSDETYERFLYGRYETMEQANEDINKRGYATLEFEFREVEDDR